MSQKTSEKPITFVKDSFIPTVLAHHDRCPPFGNAIFSKCPWRVSPYWKEHKEICCLFIMRCLIFMEDSDTVRTPAEGGFLNDVGERTLAACDATRSAGLDGQPNGIGIF